MEISVNQVEDAFLTRLAVEAIGLLCDRNFETLTQRFPYALAHDRDPAAALAADLAQCIAEAPSVEPEITFDNARYRVRYSKPNDVVLHAVVECRFASPSGDSLLVELVVVGKDRMFLALEQISVDLAAAAAV